MVLVYDVTVSNLGTTCHAVYNQYQPPMLYALVLIMGRAPPTINPFPHMHLSSMKWHSPKVAFDLPLSTIGLNHKICS